MTPARAPPSRPEVGVSAMRRGRGVSELLFLYECATQDVTRLRPVADRLGLTIQAVSHLQNRLGGQGLLERRGDRYRPTIKGVAWLERQLTSLGADVGQRLGRLRIVRVTRAIAAREIGAGSSVRLEMEHGLLTATPGPGGASRGRAKGHARRGSLVEVGDLEGIVPIVPGPIVVAVVPAREVEAPPIARAVRAALREIPHGWLGAQGIEAIWLVRRLSTEPVTRFGVAAACRDAASVGVASLAFVTDEELSRFLEPMAGPGLPPFEVRRLAH